MINIYNKIKKYNAKCDNILDEIISLLNKKYNKKYYPELNKIKVEIPINKLIIFNHTNNTKIITLYSNYFKQICNYDIDILNLIINYIITYNNLQHLLNSYNTNNTNKNNNEPESIFSYFYSPVNYVYNYFYEDSTLTTEIYEILILKEKYRDIYQYYNKKYSIINLIIKPHYNYILKSIILINL